MHADHTVIGIVFCVGDAEAQLPAVGDGPAHPWFGKRVKLSEISARELRRELGGLYRSLMTRQEGERAELEGAMTALPEG